MAPPKRIELQDWGKLESIIPPEFKEQVQDFLDDADNRVLALAAESSKLYLNPKTLAQAKKRGTRGNRKHQPNVLSENKKIAEARKVVVLLMLSHGASMVEIAETFGFSRSYISTIIDRMKLKYECRTMIEMVAKAIRSGYIE